MVRTKASVEELVGVSRGLDRLLISILLQEYPAKPNAWRPPTDVYETENAIVILIEVAGLDPDEIEVEFSDKILTIHGERLDCHPRAACHCLEVQYGEFIRQVYLPGEYDIEASTAEYKDGFLTITLPKVKLEAQTSKEGTEIINR
ncbi:MAG TPA: Hsp20/alpha crystallin family protein [Anaerolineae bacterium]|nr:Hsp20/alpha crystallin family protein [Anaerolineae bacterium]